MRLTIIYCPMIEKIIITSSDPNPFLDFSPDDLSRIVRTEDVDDATAASIHEHWKYVHTHSDFYTATPNMIAWIESPNLAVLPTFDPPMRHREKPILITDCQRHPCIGKSGSALRSYIKDGRVNKKTGKVIRLECIDLPEGRAITIEGFRRFIDRLNESIDDAATDLKN